MIWLLLAVGTVSACECFIRLPFLRNIKILVLYITKSRRAIFSENISDHWKEKILPIFAGKILCTSLVLFWLLLVSLSPFVLWQYLAVLLDLNLFALLAKPLGMVMTTVVGILYFSARKKLRHGNYGSLSKFLHKLSLSYPSVGELCFDIELSVKRRELCPSINGQHVFVSGLARAGTTILMRALYETGEFASLTYIDMPFVLAPNIWSKIVERSQRKMKKEERAHGDGILVDFDSPEAFEEVFWRTFIANSYIKKDKLLPHIVDEDIVEKFRAYVSLILRRYEKSRYLSKNNNNLLRLNSIKAAFPYSVVLIPFREPLQHSYSLMKQHQRFVRENENDPFSRKYMSWLVHHEFGSDHRPFEWKSQISDAYEIESIDYWLSQWVSTYSILLDKFEKQSPRLFFICYELICSDTERVWGALTDRLDICSPNIPDFNLQLVETPKPNNSRLKKSAEEIYQKLDNYSRSGLGL